MKINMDIKKEKPEDSEEADSLDLDKEAYYVHRISMLDSVNAQLADQIKKLENEKRYVESEIIRLQKEVRRMKLELDRLKTPPMIIGTVLDVLDDGRVIVRSSTGPDVIVYISENVDRKKLLPSTRVALNKLTLSVLDVLKSSKDPLVMGAEIIEKPDVGYEDIGGLETQINEIREAVEYPLTKPELFSKIGIEPPKGVLLTGPPGTGKTLLAKAVAKQTNAAFIRLVGSELVQKYIGEGARLVRELFELAKEKAPAIVFIDELDSIGAKRLDLATSGDREVQRTLMQLLAEMDGFDKLGEVRIIGATNRVDIIDNALLRPGRFDRIIEIPAPNLEARKVIFKIHSRKMSLDSIIDFDILARKTENATGADIKAICTEAGMFAIRENRDYVTMADFEKAIDKTLYHFGEKKEPSSMFA